MQQPISLQAVYLNGDSMLTEVDNLAASSGEVTD